MSGLRRLAALLLPGWVASEEREGTLRGIESSLLRYRVLAYTVGVGLLVLVCIGVPLQYAASSPGVVEVVGPIHGIFYMVYLVAAFDLARRSRFSIPQMLMMLCAGFLPILAFVIEWKVRRRVEAAITEARSHARPAQRLP